MKTEAQKKAQAKYRQKKAHRKTVEVFDTEADILQRLAEVKEQGEGTGKYIKRLIREDIERQKHS